MPNMSTQMEPQDDEFVGQATQHADAQEKREEEQRARDLQELLEAARNGETEGHSHTDEEYDILREQFTIWLGLPENMREPRTMDGFAKKWGLNRRTLYNWRGMPSVQRKLDRRVRHLMWDYVPEILHTTGKRAIEGSYQHARLALEVAQILDDRVQQQYEKMDEVERLQSEGEMMGDDPMNLSMDELMGQAEEMVERHKERKKALKEDNRVSPPE